MKKIKLFEKIAVSSSQCKKREKEKCDKESYLNSLPHFYFDEQWFISICF